MGSWVCAPVVIWVFVGRASVGFCWLWSQICGFGSAQWRCRWFGRESWVSPLVWPWVVGVSVGVAMGRGCGVGFFLLGLLGSDGGSVFGYSGGLVVGCACVVGCRLICGVGLVVLWVVV